MEQFSPKEVAMARYEKRIDSLITYVEKECFCDKVAAGIQTLMREQIHRVKSALGNALNTELGGDLSSTELDFQEVTIESLEVFAEAQKLEGMIAVVRKKNANSRWDLSSLQEQYKAA